MKIFRLFLFALILGGLLYFYYHTVYLKRSQDKKENAALVETELSQEEFPKLLLGSREELESFVLTRKNLRAKFRKIDGNWYLVSPVKALADPYFINTLFKTLHEITLEKVFRADKDKLSQYDLSSPSYELELITTEQPERRTFEIGNDMVGGNGYYARWKGETSVFVVTGPIKPLLQAPLASMRSENIFAKPRSEVTALERSWNGAVMVAELKDGVWRMSKPDSHVMSDDKLRAYISKFWNVSIEDFPDEYQVPDVSGENYILFKLDDGSEWKLLVGRLNKKIGAYPVFFPSKSIKAWVAKDNLESLVNTNPEELFSKRFVTIPIEKLDRVEVLTDDQKIFFKNKSGVWNHVGKRQIKTPFEALEVLLLKLNDLEYVQSLDRNQKAALMFDPGEARLKILFFRPNQTRSFLELKWYIRDDYYYLEINDAPPLYVLNPQQMKFLFNILAPLVQGR